MADFIPKSPPARIAEEIAIDLGPGECLRDVCANSFECACPCCTMVPDGRWVRVVLLVREIDVSERDKELLAKYNTRNIDKAQALAEIDRLNAITAQAASEATP